VTRLESDEGGFVIDAETWLSELLPDLSPEDRALLSDVDREIIFDALVEFAALRPGDLEVRHQAPGAQMTTDAPWLVPGTSIHVRAEAGVRDALKRLVRTATVAAIVGSATAGFVGLTVDVVLGIFERTSRLDDVDFEIVQMIGELRKSGDEPLPGDDDLRRAFPDLDDLPQRLASLKERGVIAGDSRGWQVRF
jgi:hypothetical protein